MVNFDQLKKEKERDRTDNVNLKKDILDKE